MQTLQNKAEASALTKVHSYCLTTHYVSFRLNLMRKNGEGLNSNKILSLTQMLPLI